VKSRTLRTSDPIDLRLTLAPLRHGPRDPTIRLRRGESWRATRTPEGPAGTYIRSLADRVEVSAWGPGASWALEHAPDLVGLHDDPRGFEPTDDFMARLHKGAGGLRMCRSLSVVESLLPTVLEQKVTSDEAHDAYARIVWKLNEPAPGPCRLMLPPDPKNVARLPYWWFHPFGVERKRADLMIRVCARAGRLEEAVSMERDAAERRLRALPGIGAWTAAHIAQAAFGDPDAVIVGDFHLPHIVTWTLASEPRGSDERMLELLEPYLGQRARAVRLLVLAGGRPPNRSIRRPIRKIQHI
jgi:3-methyladenine DNA glycosylase/8-oxoguanine DNA glycosylase